MANTDIRISIGFWDHPKTVKLERRVGLEGVKALLMLWQWVAQYEPIGYLYGMDEEGLEIAARWQGESGKLAKTLLELKFIDPLPDDPGYSIHDWKIHNSWASDAQSREDKARFSSLKRWNEEEYKALKAKGIDEISKADFERLKKRKRKEPEPKPEMPNNATAMGTHMGAHALGNAPSPSPSPSPIPSLKTDQKQDHPFSPSKTAEKVAFPVLFKELQDTWNNIMPSRGKPAVKSITEQRKPKIRRLWKDTPDADFRLIESWKSFFEYCAQSEFLLSGTWFTFDWVINPTNFQKIIEGNYHAPAGGKGKRWERH